MPAVNPSCHRLAVFLCCAAAALCAGCELMGPPKPQEFRAVVTVESDPGVAVDGAKVVWQKQVLATTDASGRASVSLAGQEGDTFNLVITCPDAFKSPVKPLVVVFRKLVGADGAEYTTACPPKTRAVVVVVRAQNGPNLPVFHLGKQVGTTDSSGVAHVVFDLPAGSPLELRLKADEGPIPLRPAEAIASFTVRDQDDIYVFDQKFEKIPQRVRRKPRPVRVDGPTPL